MSQRFAGFFSFLLVVLFFTPTASWAQDAFTGALRGTVSDSTGARIVRAEVAIENTATGETRVLSTDANGNFVAQFLAPGEYKVQVSARTMETHIRPAVRIELGAVVELRFKLFPAETKETVIVRDNPSGVETQAVGVSNVVDERAIAELPINGRRFSDLALLTPGVTQDPRGLTSDSNGDLAAGGIRGFQTSFLVDGADNNNGFFSQAAGRYRSPYQFSTEVVREFRVATSGYGAEQGRAGAAVINVVTKSGGNKTHGSAFYFLRDSLFNARYANLGYQPSDRRQQFGGTVGGPVIHNRIFFFAGFDQHVFHVPTVVRFNDGSSVLVPQPGAGPLFDGDYEDSDKAQVFAAAGQLNTMGGNFQSALLGNTGFLKLDGALTHRHHLSVRLSTSRFWGQNNVFFDPASPVTTFALSENGEEQVTTGAVNVTLNSAFSARFTNHLRAQVSRDWQDSSSNSSDPRTRIKDVFDGFGRSSILPRQTRQRRIHLAETFNFENGRNSWKFGGDAVLSRTHNFFPSLFGGEYIFEKIRVNPFTFEPETFGLRLSPLRAYAHQVPRFYIQNFGSAVSNPDTNEYALFIQDTLRVNQHFAISMGVRYDLQSFGRKGLQSNPLWSQSGKLPSDKNNFAPRVGVAWSIGDNHPIVARAGYGLFTTRIPQIYDSTIATDNGINSFNMILDNANFFDHQIFPTYPNPLVNCPVTATTCTAPPEALSHLSADIAAFAANYRTPSVQQASISIEREVARRVIATVSYLHVHGQNLIRSRDVNLPPPTDVQYPVFDGSDVNLLGYYNVDTFSTWQLSRSLTCPFPPCINPLNRPIPQLGSINQFDTTGSSLYDGLTVSLQRRMTSGVYFRMGYTWAHAIDNGQDALVAGRPASVQNTFSTKSEKASSVTDQRQRLVLSWIAEPNPVGRSHGILSALLDDWRFSSVATIGTGRPVEAKVLGDPNQDGNSANDRLPGVGRNAYTGPSYFTTDLRVVRKFHIRGTAKLEVIAESFNVFNRLNQRFRNSDDNFNNTAGQFTQISGRVGNTFFPAHYQTNSGFLKATGAYAPRQLQLALRLSF